MFTVFGQTSALTPARRTVVANAESAKSIARSYVTTEKGSYGWVSNDRGDIIFRAESA